ncbi:MAG: vWA domain-containing protein [Candidatus Helarchaeota archaeon]
MKKSVILLFGLFTVLSIVPMINISPNGIDLNQFYCLQWLSIQLSPNSYNGIYIGDAWTINSNYNGQISHLSYEVTSITDFVYGNYYTDGKLTGENSYLPVLDDASISYYVGLYGSYSDNYGGRSITVVCINVTLSMGYPYWVIYDTVTGIEVELHSDDGLNYIHYYLESWDIYQGNTCPHGKKGTGIMLVIDKSGSIQHDDAISSSQLILKYISPYTFIGLTVFDSNDYLKHGLAQPAKNDYYNQLSNLLSDVGSGGMTNIYAGLMNAIQQLDRRCFEVNHIILFTDGYTNTADSGYQQFRYCSLSDSGDGRSYKEQWQNSSLSPLQIAKRKGITITVIAIDPEVPNPHFFDVVQAVNPNNKCYDCNDIWEVIDYLQDMYRSAEDWDHWQGWKGQVDDGTCKEITGGGLDVSSKHGYVLALRLWWSNPNNYGVIRVTDQSDVTIPLIPPTSNVGDRPFVAYFNCSTSITTVYIYVCINTLELGSSSPDPVDYDFDIDTKNESDFEVWMTDTHPSGGGADMTPLLLALTMEPSDSGAIAWVTVGVITGIITAVAIIVIIKRKY